MDLSVSAELTESQHPTDRSMLRKSPFRTMSLNHHQTGTRESLPDLLARLATAERQLHELRDHLDHAQRLAALGTLTALVAHEFNNILTPTVSYCQMALASPQDHPLALKALRKAEAAATRATEISAAILGFAKPSHSRPGGSLDHQHVANISSAVSSALACLSRDLNKDSIGLRMDIDSAASVRMRPVALQQVFLNLILNARRAMIPRGGTLTFHTEPLTTALAAPPSAVVGGCAQILDQPRESGPRLMICVSDTGAGMTNEALRRLFVPFSSQSGHGSGLGLVVCLKLIQDAGGAVIVESEPGKGTSFTICLYSVNNQS